MVPYSRKTPPKRRRKICRFLCHVDRYHDRKEMEILLEELSHKDSLTGIANRRKFDEIHKKEYNRLNRLKLKLSVILFDIDFFKEYNDHYDHVKGDEELREFGLVLNDCISCYGDLASRYGG